MLTGSSSVPGRTSIWPSGGSLVAGPHSSQSTEDLLRNRRMLGQPPPTSTGNFADSAVEKNAGRQEDFESNHHLNNHYHQNINAVNQLNNATSASALQEALRHTSALPTTNSLQVSSSEQTNQLMMMSAEDKLLSANYPAAHLVASSHSHINETLISRLQQYNTPLSSLNLNLTHGGGGDGSGANELTSAATGNVGSGGGRGPFTSYEWLMIVTLISIILISIVGNLLVCVAIFTDRRLRKLGNAFIVSLAIADLFVSFLVMTFALHNDLMEEWAFGAWFCDIWISFDIMCCTASILNLCAISLDRFIHIKDCLLYNQLMTRRVALSAVIMIWIISALVSFVPITLGWHKPSASGSGSGGGGSSSQSYSPRSALPILAQSPEADLSSLRQPLPPTPPPPQLPVTMASGIFGGDEDAAFYQDKKGAPGGRRRRAKRETLKTTSLASMSENGSSRGRSRHRKSVDKLNYSRVAALVAQDELPNEPIGSGPPLDFLRLHNHKDERRTSATASPTTTTTSECQEPEAGGQRQFLHTNADDAGGRRREVPSVVEAEALAPKAQVYEAQVGGGDGDDDDDEGEKSNLAREERNSLPDGDRHHHRHRQNQQANSVEQIKRLPSGGAKGQEQRRRLRRQIVPLEGAQDKAEDTPRAHGNEYDYEQQEQTASLPPARLPSAPSTERSHSFGKLPESGAAHNQWHAAATADSAANVRPTATTLTSGGGGYEPAQCMLTLTPTYAVISSTISFYIPCIIMLGLYSKLFACARRHVRNIKAISRAPHPIVDCSNPAAAAAAAQPAHNLVGISTASGGAKGSTNKRTSSSSASASNSVEASGGGGSGGLASRAKRLIGATTGLSSTNHACLSAGVLQATANNNNNNNQELSCITETTCGPHDEMSPVSGENAATAFSGANTRKAEFTTKSSPSPTAVKLFGPARVFGSRARTWIKFRRGAGPSATQSKGAAPNSGGSSQAAAPPGSPQRSSRAATSSSSQPAAPPRLVLKSILSSSEKTRQQQQQQQQLKAASAGRLPERRDSKNDDSATFNRKHDDDHDKSSEPHSANELEPFLASDGAPGGDKARHSDAIDDNFKSASDAAVSKLNMISGDQPPPPPVRQEISTAARAPSPAGNLQVLRNQQQQQQQKMRFQQQQQQQQQQQRTKQQTNTLDTHKAAVTLGIIMGTFLLCWLPFFCLNIIKAFCADLIPSSLFRASTWLGYANSALNPIIYGIHNSEFRNAFNRIFFKHLMLKNGRQYLNRRFSYDLRPHRNSGGGGSGHNNNNNNHHRNQHHLLPQPNLNHSSGASPERVLPTAANAINKQAALRERTQLVELAQRESQHPTNSQTAANQQQQQQQQQPAAVVHKVPDSSKSHLTPLCNSNNSNSIRKQPQKKKKKSFEPVEEAAQCLNLLNRLQDNQQQQQQQSNFGFVTPSSVTIPHRTTSEHPQPGADCISATGDQRQAPLAISTEG